MRTLLDTHTLLWWLNDNENLSATARGIVNRAGNEIFVSAASAWEIATKARLGRLPGGMELAHHFSEVLAHGNFKDLPVLTEHGIRAGLLGGPHKDPFDRMLIAQALAEHLAIVSNDIALDGYGVQRIW